MSSAAWINGCFLSIGASVIGAASNLCIRHSYLLEQQRQSNTKLLTKQQPQDVSKDDDTTRHYSAQSSSSAATELTTTTTSLSSNSDSAQESDLHITAAAADTNTKNKIQPLLLRTIGILGISALNPILNITALHYASPSILSPLGGLTLVFMVLLSEPMIGEVSSSVQLVGAALIIAGEFVLTVFGDHTNDLVLTMSDIREQYMEYAFVAYFVGLSIWMMMVVTWIRWGNGTWQRFAWGVAAGSMAGSNPFLKDAMAVLAGMMTTAAASNSDDDEVASGANMVYDDAPLRSIGFYVLILLAAMFPLASLFLSLECMKRYDATYSAACLLASQTVVATLMSMAHYHTWDHLSSYALYPFGLVVLLLGCIVLAMEEGDEDDVVARKNQNREMKLLLSEETIEYGTVHSP